MDNILQYVDKLFFYCLKKCKDKNDAEELSSQVIFEVLTAIHNNRKIKDLESYIFSVANNQYNRFIKNKVNIREHEVNIEKSMIESYASEETIKEKIFKDEQYNIAISQIKTLSKDYLYILYGYYIEDKTLKTISIEMNLPLGTVKRKLFELRNKLMEAVKMEKLNGKKAYIPDNYFISTSGYIKKDLRKEVDLLIVKNLLSHCYDNPCTLQDFSLELGISIPYVEDIVNKLKYIEFIKELDNGRYVSNVAFVSLDFRDKTMSYLLNNSEMYLSKLHTFCKKHLLTFKSILGLDIKDKLLMWSMMHYIHGVCEERALKKERERPFKKFGNDCDFTFEEQGTLNYKKELLYTFSHNINGNDPKTHISYWAFPCDSFGVKDEHRSIAYPNNLQGMEVHLDVLKQLYNLNNKKMSELTEQEKQNVLRSSQDNYVRIEDDVVKFNCTYFNEEKYKQLIKRINDSEELDEVVNEYKKLYININNKASNYIPSYLSDRVEEICIVAMCRVRGIVFDYFMSKGELEIPESGKFVHNAVFWEIDFSKPWSND